MVRQSEAVAGVNDEAQRETCSIRTGLGGNHRRPCSVVSLERAGPGVGGSVVLPLSVSVGLALELLLTDVFVGVVSVDLGGGDEGDKGSDEFHYLIL